MSDKLLTCSRCTANLLVDSKGNTWWYSYSTYKFDGRVWLHMVNLDSLDFFGKYMQSMDILFKTEEEANEELFRRLADGSFVPDTSSGYSYELDAFDIEADGFRYLVALPSPQRVSSVAYVCKYKDSHINGELYHSFVYPTNTDNVDENATIAVSVYPEALALEMDWWKYEADYGKSEPKHFIRDFEKE